MAIPQGALFEGPITVIRSGKGFFKIPDSEEELFVPGENLGTAFPGDVVKIQVSGTNTDPKSGETRNTGNVVGIVKRARETFVGTIVPSDPANEFGLPGQFFLIPDHKKMYTPFLMVGDSMPVGQKVVARFQGWEKGQLRPSATLDEIIGPAGVHETEMRALALSQGFSSNFPPGVEKEAAELDKNGKDQLAGEVEAAVASGARRDFRSITTFTIDPYDAKDFDDALSVRELPDGNTEIGVHIADVSFYVRPGTAIDDEGRERATSVYLVDRTIPMLPEVLSNNLCSLNPNEDRLAVSAVFVLNKNAEIVEKWFGETVIHSDKRFTYENAQEVLDNNEGEYLKELVTLRDLADKIRARRVAKGAIAFDTPEIKVKLDENGKPIEVLLKERRATNLLIEDFMLLANEHVSEYLTKKGEAAGLEGSVVYRVHDVPDADRIENLSQFLKVLGYHLDSQNGKVKGTAINALLESVVGKPEEYLIKVAALRSMAKAVYSTKNIGHFGLAFEFYSHFTSPIRRYPDLLTHRMVKHYAEREKITKTEIAELEGLAQHSSEREVSAAEAERDSVKMKLVEFMVDKVGDEFDAVISGVSDRGLYVELKETHAEGLVNVRALGDDYFDHDQKRYRLVGRRTKKEYALGDGIRVKLLAARVQDKELDFTLAAST
ncbi:MAG: ribonuclease R [Parcubacteria bacterium C7867-007]|nr:MAG: ribonuclease R [Parcubacteria bacterium C7867-007]